MRLVAILLLSLLAACPSSSTGPGPRYADNDDDDDDDDDGDDDGGRDTATTGGDDTANAGGSGNDDGSDDDGTAGGGETAPAVDDATVAAIKPQRGPSGYGMLLVPDLTGMTADQAATALRAAGFKFQRLETTDNACGHSDEDQMMRLGAVCAQEPLAGAERLPKLMQAKITIERDTYEHGSIGGSSEWRRMPDVAGKSLATARTMLERASLPLDEQFEIVKTSESGCAKGAVCRTEPVGKGRKVLARKGQIYVGK
jgi:PASTA domain